MTEKQIAQMEKLAGLHKKGILTDEEFNAQKKRMLDASSGENGSVMSEEQITQLEKLADLHEKGILTDEEFNAQKKGILESSSVKNADDKNIPTDNLTLANDAQPNANEQKNVKISFMPDALSKVLFYGALAISIFGGITTIWGFIFVPLVLFVLKQKLDARAKGFIIDYDKKIIYFPDFISVTYDTGSSLKTFFYDFRDGKEISFAELKNVYSGGVEWEEKTDSRGISTTTQYKILNITTTFGSIKFKLRHDNTRFEKIAESLYEVLEYKNAMAASKTL